MTDFPRLFEPGEIGSLKLKNRIIFAPLVTHMVTEKGYVTNRQIEYYVERAKGGASLVVVEASYPRPSVYPGRITLGNDGAVLGLEELVKTIHKEGAKVVCEVNPHRGRRDELDSASPSDVSNPVTGEAVKELMIQDLDKLKAEFRMGVKRVLKAGFDGIMIHGASGYLVAEFLSPLINRRTDEYGGNLRGRAKFALELVDVTRETAGSHYPLIFRLAADERVPGGFGIKDAIPLCKMLEEAGVNAVDITSGSWEGREWIAPTAYLPSGCNVELSKSIKQDVKIPVAATGKINDPYLAEKILREGKADYICMARGLLADPYFPQKAMEGRIGDICKCITCGTCGELFWGKKPVACAINPASGREREFTAKQKPAAKKKRVLVIGGGPAGMEAAIVAARKAHDVVLWEKSNKLGGQLNVASKPPCKEGISFLLDYLEKQIKNSTVKIESNKMATLETVEAFHPEAVVIAIGAIPFVPSIPGVEGENVVDCRMVLTGEKEVGNRVIVLGGGYIGCETALFLAKQQKDVTLAFRSAAPALDIIHPNNRLGLLKFLVDSKVKIQAKVKEYKEITLEGIRFINREGNEVFREANNIVLATGATPNKTLASLLRGKIPELYEVGDCVEPRRISEAIHEGANAALKI